MTTPDLPHESLPSTPNQPAIVNRLNRYAGL